MGMSNIALLLALAGLALTAGCRSATKLSEVPRVDLQLEGGNRGFLVGTAPPAGELKTTRQIVESTIEVPSFYRAKRTGAKVSLDDVAPPEMAAGEDVEIAEAAPGGAQVFDVYVVKKGDSLWSIAARPEIYGKATKWRQIFDANRDLLKSPDRVRPGMTLKIPRGDDGSVSASTTYEDEGISYKK
jgi:nucleoid-associated protein YgaU